jgi:hypothetical protein
VVAALVWNGKLTGRSLRPYRGKSVSKGTRRSHGAATEFTGRAAFFPDVRLLGTLAEGLIEKGYAPSA